MQTLQADVEVLGGSDVGPTMVNVMQRHLYAFDLATCGAYFMVAAL